MPSAIQLKKALKKTMKNWIEINLITIKFKMADINNLSIAIKF
jgi:hypothetical protein